MNRKRHLNRACTFRFRRFARKAYSAFSSMHRVVNIGVVAGCMLTFAHATQTAAQPAAAPDALPTDSLREETLEEVTVTASHLETPLSQTSKIVTVITRAQIEQAPVRSIQDLLVYAANVDVIQRGGHGVQSDISIRGGSADQTAVLLNGVNFSNPHTGHYSFDLPINLSDIERIEIVHGPSALIYGSSAFSGGINIITKQKVETPLYLAAEAGMHALRGGEVRGALEAGPTTSSLSVGHRASDGYIAGSDYAIWNAFWQTRVRFSGDNRLDIQAGYESKNYGANTFYTALYPNQYERTSAWTGSVKGAFGGALKVVPILYWNRHYDQFDLIKDTDKGRNFHRGDTYGANLIFQYTWRGGVTSLGGELRREEIISSKLGTPMATPNGHYTRSDARTIVSATAEHTWTWQRWAASAGVMMQRNTLLDGVRFYPSAGLAYRPTDDLKLNATWSRSTRMPTFTDLYYTTETHTANVGLKPERSESVDLGVTFTRPAVTLRLVGYLMWGRDVIDWVRDSGTAKWASWNFTEIDKQGVEVGATFRPGAIWPSMRGTVLNVDYARMNQTADSHGLESRYSLNYLRDKVTVGLQHPIFRGLTASWHFRAQKRMGSYRRYVDKKDMGLEPYPAFSTLDLKLNYAVRKFDFHLDLNNMFNVTYYDIGNVPQAGFWLMGGVAFKL